MKIVNREDSAVIQTPHGSEIRPLIDRTNSEIVRCSLAEEILPPGSAVGRHHHLKTEEIYYILSGTGTMTVGEEVKSVRAGDAIFIPISQIHTLSNTGNEPIRLLLICGPAHDFADHNAD